MDAPLDEREQLHHLLMTQLDAEQFSFTRLLRLLSCWLAERNEPNWQENCPLAPT